MDDAELGRLLRMSQDTTGANQNAVLASHFGVVAAELLVARKWVLTMKDKEEKIGKILAECSDHGCFQCGGTSPLIEKLKEVLGYE